MNTDELFDKYSKIVYPSHKIKYLSKDDFTKALAEALCCSQVQQLVMADYEAAIIKFDNCRACLARLAEKLKIELPNEAPSGVTEWHEHLIYELDKWKP